MSDQTSFKLSLYSPRWGHDDTYDVEVSRDHIIIKLTAKHANCSWKEGGDPEWSGHNDNSGNPLENILNDDLIFPPNVFVFALERAWIHWRDGAIDDDQIEEHLQDLCDWVNIVSKNKPKSEFWRPIF